LKHDLFPVPTSVFQDSGDIRIAKAKSILKANLEMQVSRRIHSGKGAVVVDGNTTLWCLNWTKDEFLSHLAEAMDE